MAKKYKILETDPKTNTHEFLVDDAADLVKLPKETGSLAFMANTGDLYVCNNLKEWKNVSDPDAPEIVNPSGTLTITENGTGIDVTEYAAVNVNVVNNGGGANFGELQIAPVLASTKPTVGDGVPATYLMSMTVGLDAQTPLSTLYDGGDVACGAYVIGYTGGGDNTVDAYVCGIGAGQSNWVYTTVEEWDGQIDTLEDGNIGFIMPDLGGIPSETAPEAILVLHAHGGQ